MNLADERLRALDGPSLTADERAVPRCQAAADLIQIGQYEAAREALGELWRGIGERPDLGGLSEPAAAEVLLQAGALSGWLGASGQVAGAQEAAKDLISESAARFESLGEAARAALARSDLALCYWREGGYDEARVLLKDALESATGTAERAKVLLRLTTVEFSAARYNDALTLLKEHAHVFDERVSHALRGSFHNHLALVLKQLGTVEQRPDYLDQAIIEFTAAIHHHEQSGHERYRATNENNLANLLRKMGHYRQAHEHLDRAGAALVRLRDAGLLAQVDETRARVLIAEQRYPEANEVIGRAVQTLERGSAAALLADAYTVQGIAWARLCAYDSSLKILRRAMSLAEESGALYNAGLAALTLIEEHGARRLPEDELLSVYLRADEIVGGSQDAEEVARLRDCARLIIRRVAGLRLNDRNFSLHGAVHDLEARYIARALDEAGGSVTRAAKLLGVGHQSLSIILNTRHTKLLGKRTPARERRKSIIKQLPKN
ncbi:MAG TPA: helix-turn-helix domain-containing protein [Pyrinomonadaceae bacterium]|nr:helix-turn-helix domain-containing protein [Pyrinomonadaceae bacterium]